MIHQCGPRNRPAVTEAAAGLPPELRARYHPVEYLNAGLPDVYAVDDVMVARAGAGAELTALGKACILVPLIPTGGDEQRHTAWHLAENDAARMLAAEDAIPQAMRADAAVGSSVRTPADTAARTLPGTSSASCWTLPGTIDRRRSRPGIVTPVTTDGGPGMPITASVCG